jgi:hypothetical protein
MVHALLQTVSFTLKSHLEDAAAAALSSLLPGIMEVGVY